MVKRFLFWAALLLAGGAWSLAWAQSTRPGWGAVPYADAAGTGVTFRVWATTATQVTVFGSFNGWNSNSTPLVLEMPTNNGIWSADVPAARAGDQYRFSINQALVRRDPRARRVVHSGDAPGIIHDPGAYEWSTREHLPPAPEELVLYELHIGTFNHPRPTPNQVGTFTQASARLDHVAALGFNAIQLMPVAEFAGNNSWGYNPIDPYAVESAYGGPDAFKAFVDACHARSLAVILDTVHNHYGAGDDLQHSLWEFDGWRGFSGGGIYFAQDPAKAETPWGPRPDFSRPQVRQYIRDNIRMWLEDFRVDGLRWDATLYIRQTTNFTPIADGAALLRDINDWMAMEFPEKIRIAEDLTGDWLVTTPSTESGGLGFQSQWDRTFHEDVTRQITNDATRDLGAVAAHMAWSGDVRRVVYTESHDEVGYLNEDEGAKRFPAEIAPGAPFGLLARKKSTLGAALAFTAPGIPMIMQGQEMLENELFSTTNGMDWAKTTNYPGMVRLYRDLAGLRRNRDGVTAGLAGEIATASVTNNGTLLLVRRGIRGQPGNDVFVVANFSPNQVAGYWIDFPAANTWHVHFNSDSNAYSPDFLNRGSTAVFVWPDLRGDVTVAPWSVLVLSQQPPAASDSDGDGMPDTWETARSLDPNDPNDAWLNPDGDAYTHREEFRADTDPHVWNPPAAAHANLAVAGDFNDWKTAADFMARIDDGLWQRDLLLPAGTIQFKFAANMSWSNNWGGLATPVLIPPVTAPLAEFGDNLTLTNLPAGTYRFRFDEQRLRFTVRPIAAADSDLDGMPDDWETDHGLDPLVSRDALENPDGDLYSNLEEYRLDLDPQIPDASQTDYAGMAVAVTHNGWNNTPNMAPHDSLHHTWTLLTNLTTRTGIVFKFAAEGSWSNNWGDSNPPHTSWPLAGTADFMGSDIKITRPMKGNFRFTFHERTREYSVGFADPDVDGDGLPDDWEEEYFGTAAGDTPDNNPDQDLYTNEDEYFRGSNPTVWDPPEANYPSLAVAGTFNGWSTTANMTLTNHHLWQYVHEFARTDQVAFKFAAHGNWNTNWGHSRTSSLPMSGTAVRQAGNIGISNLHGGAVIFTFNDQTLAYTVAYENPPVLLSLDATPAGNAGFVIRWNSADGQVFRVRRGADLRDTNSFVTLAPSVSATPTLNVYTDSAPAATTGFYQIQILE